jgi:hypothetical protein
VGEFVGVCDLLTRRQPTARAPHTDVPQRGCGHLATRFQRARPPSMKAHQISTDRAKAIGRSYQALRAP